MIKYIKAKISHLISRIFGSLVHKELESLRRDLDQTIGGRLETQKGEILHLWKEMQNPRINTPDSFLREFEEYQELSNSSSGLLPIRWEDRFPCLNDRNSSGGFDRHYILHTAWASRVLARYRPAKHVDVGSWLAFVVSVSAFVPTEFYDFNPVALPLSGLNTGKANLLSLPFADSSIPSLSCMHVIEHVGLGRYGDPLDPQGDLHAIKELSRALAPGGNLLIVLPMGRGRIEFNAHRVYDLESAKKLFSGLEIKEFTLIPDDAKDGAFVESPSVEFVASQNYACGCFLLSKS